MYINFGACSVKKRGVYVPHYPIKTLPQGILVNPLGVKFLKYNGVHIYTPHSVMVTVGLALVKTVL